MILQQNVLIFFTNEQKRKACEGDSAESKIYSRKLYVICGKNLFYGNHSLFQLIFMKKFQVTEACSGCGICGEICPVGNILLEKGKAVHGDRCAACYGCLHWCPVYATHLRVSMLSNRPQYHHPEISLEEIIGRE